MALETANYVGGLVATNPTATDPKSQGDDHLRLIKAVLLNAFAGFPGMIVVTGTEAQGATASDYTLTLSPAPAAYTSPMLAVFKATHANTGAATVQIGALGTKPLIAVDGTALKSGDIESGGLVAVFYDGTSFFLISGNDRADRNGETYSGTHDFTGATPKVPTKTQGDNSTNAASTAYVDASTAAEAATRSTNDNTLQSNINAEAATRAAVDATKADLASPALTGTPTAPTAAPGTNSTQIATTAFAVQLAFAAALPAQTGNSGKVITTDGTTASWSATKTIKGQSLIGAGAVAVADLQEFTTSGTWNKPSGATFVLVEMYGGGAGGGSGCRGGTTSLTGGAGGGGGAYISKMFLASDLASSVSVTIGAGGSGGTAITSNSTNGDNGGTGGDTSFGSYVTAYGGGSGGGGLAGSNTSWGGGGGVGSAGAANTAGSPSQGQTTTTAGDNGPNMFGGGAVASNSNQPPGATGWGGGAGGRTYVTINYNAGFGSGSVSGGGGGGAGGSLDAGGAATVGGSGGASYMPTTNGGTGGAVATNGGAGSSRSGGGGGGGNTAGIGGTGGAGGFPAGGGGGGGASTSGNNSGAGGAGANGYARIISW